MGAYATVHFGLRYAGRALSLTAVALGYGSQPHVRDKFRANSATLADEIEKLGAEKFAEGYALGPYRLQLKQKDERSWLEFKRMLQSIQPLERRRQCAAFRKSVRACMNWKQILVN